ncbi:cyclic peptide export ABC transporter [Duganella sp. CT11-25]|uniref:cyclic peptide export ABC transporter n=1 Tax=unclassified Duganella TaxID=2636909 RepID=UPI0039B10593
MNMMKYLYQHSRGLLFSATAVGLICGLCGTFLAMLISRTVSGEPKTALLAGVFFLTCLLQVSSKSLSEILMLKLAQRAIARLRVTVSEKLLATPQRRLQELGKPGLLAIATRDVDNFIQALQNVPILFGNAIVLLTCLAYIAWLSWTVFLTFVVTLVIGMLAFSAAERKPLRDLVSLREQIDTMYGYFRDLIEGSRELQMNRQRGEMFIGKVIRPGADKFRDTYVRSMSGYVWVLNIGNILFYAVIGVVLFVVPLWSREANETLTKVTMMLLFLIRPISDIMMLLPSARQGNIALRRIRQLDADLQAPETAPAVNLVPAPTPANWQITLSQLQHRYLNESERSFQLGPMDLSLEAGEIVFIVGGNGSGKTTLAMLLLGLYEPDQGQISWNGVPVGAHNAADYRALFSAVFADFYLFEQLLTIDADQEERARHYLRLLEMDGKVEIVDGAFSTTALSTGQRKRLALVVAYLEDRSIYVFDEWAADQDPVFKRVFYTVLLPDLKRRGKTVVIITHDDAYFSCADRVVKLEAGKLVTISASALHAAA